MSFIINPYRFGTAPATFDPDTDTLTDAIVTDAAIVEFHYSGAGQSPSGARVYTDSIATDLSVVEFHYAAAGQSPSGSRVYTDDIATDVGIVNFSYTT
jgi:hypothetical protein